MMIPSVKNVGYSYNYTFLESNLASATVLNTGFSGSQVTSGPTLGIVSADYASSDEDFSETEDVENPSFSMFCQGLRTFCIQSRVMPDKQHLKDINRMLINPLSVSRIRLEIALSSDVRPQQRQPHRTLDEISKNSIHYSRERPDPIANNKIML